MNELDNEKMMEYQMLEQQMQSIGKNLEQLEANIDEINRVEKTIDDFKELKKGDKILVPISSGIFAEATLDNVKTLKVNVGANVLTEKDPEKTKKLIAEQKKELEGHKAETMSYFEQMYTKLASLQTELSKEEKK